MMRRRPSLMHLYSGRPMQFRSGVDSGRILSDIIGRLHPGWTAIGTAAVEEEASEEIRYRPAGLFRKLPPYRS